MTFTIDTKPPPAPSLRENIDQLLIGQSLCAPQVSIKALRTTASRVQAQHKGRRYRCKNEPEGPRVWRLA